MVGKDIDSRSLERILISSLDTLYANSLEIIVSDVAERTLCARLAAILQRNFDEYDVDVEYNRHGVRPKDIELPDADGVLTSNRVSPDIIVHQPGHDDANLLVVEVKKTTNAQPENSDLFKLAQIKEQLSYRFAVFLRLPAGATADRADVRLVWVPEQ